MKKLLYTMMGCLMLGLTVISCSDDDGDEVINYETTAEKAAAGTYSGTWSQVSDDGTKDYQGTITIEAGDTVGVANITFTCTETSLNATSKANIWNAGRGFQFVNQADAATGLGASFAGRIAENGTLTTSFTTKAKVGRKQVTVVYNFSGQK